MSDYRLFKRGTESLPAEHQWLHRQLSGAAYTSFRSALLQLYSMLHTVFNVNITVVVPIFSLVSASRTGTKRQSPRQQSKNT